MTTKHDTKTTTHPDPEAILPDRFQRKRRTLLAIVLVLFLALAAIAIALSEASTWDATRYGSALALQYVGLSALFVGGVNVVLLLFWWVYLVPSFGPFFHQDHRHAAYVEA